MRSANWRCLPSHFWHVTRSCLRKEFLLKFAKDRKRPFYGLIEAGKCWVLRGNGQLVGGRTDTRSEIRPSPAECCSRYHGGSFARQRRSSCYGVSQLPCIPKAVNR
jgi:hypothetical protein